MRPLFAFILLVGLSCQAQLSHENIIIEKNFYVVAALKKYPALQRKLPGWRMQPARVEEYIYDSLDQKQLLDSLGFVFDRNMAAVAAFVNQELKGSGHYKLYDSLSSRQLWLAGWKLYFTGINYIINQYGLGKKMRYPNIDSALYNVPGNYYQELLKTMFVVLKPRLDAAKYFYDGPLAVALELMQLNERDEPARHEPLEKGENKLAAERVRRVKFSEFKYSAIVVPGDGPARGDIKLSPFSVMRCEMAAEAYAKRLAPFIILTGGYCHPFKTPYAEAIEMKKYLVERLAVPSYGIIIDPHARHTTTNFRNASRYIIRYGLPVDKKAVLLTTVEQADYISDPRFDARNIRELGYLPYTFKERISRHEIEFLPSVKCLHRDPTDPLDP